MKATLARINPKKVNLEVHGKEKVLELKSLFVTIESRSILNDVSLVVNQGDFIGLTGPNGAGKSTLVKAVLGLLPQYKGEIYLFGVKQNRFNDFEKIGYFPQKNALVRQVIPVSVAEIITTGIANSREGFLRTNTKLKDKVEKVLEKLQISHLKEKIFSSLSGGEQQKVLLARTLVDEPELIILDEPSTALDSTARNDFLHLLKGLNQGGATIIIITHDTGYVGKFAKKILYLDGEVKYYDFLDKEKTSESMQGYFEKTETHLIWHQHE